MERVCISVTLDVCMCWFMGVCVPAMQMNGGRLKYICQQNANSDNKEGLHVFQPSCAACVFNSTTPLPSPS